MWFELGSTQVYTETMGGGAMGLLAKVGPLCLPTFLAVTGQPLPCPILLPGGQYLAAPQSKDVRTGGPFSPALQRENRSTGREGTSLTFLCPRSERDAWWP